MRATLSDLERRFLADPPRALARIATVGADGAPHVVPTGWSFDAATGELVLGGRDVAGTARARHVRATGRAAVVVDGLAPGPGWSPWAFVVRGRAVVDERAGAIRVACDEVTSWGLEAVTSPAHAPGAARPDAPPSPGPTTSSVPAGR